MTDLHSAVQSENIRARVTLALLGLGLLLNVAGVVSGMVQLDLLTAVQGGMELTAERAAANDTRQQLVGLAQVVGFIATAVSWLLWQYRAYSNLTLVGSRDTDVSPGWSVGYWFIPLVNLVRGYSITAELWRRSELKNMRDPIGALSGTPLLVAWWIVYLGSGAVSRYFAFSVRNAHTMGDLASATGVGILGDVVSFVSCILAFRVVKGIDQFQREFAASTTSPSGLA